MLDSWIQEIGRKKQNRVEIFHTFGTKTFCVPLEKPERLREGSRVKWRRVEKQVSETGQEDKRLVNEGERKAYSRVCKVYSRKEQKFFCDEFFCNSAQKLWLD